MNTLVKSLCCLGLFAGSISAAQIQGVLMDKSCSSKAVSGGQKAAASHDRECALAPACQKSGYGVFTSDGKWLSFDEAGNKQALVALNASKKADNLKVTVTGDVQGDMIKVTDLKLN
jgi:hypothetical protein